MELLPYSQDTVFSFAGNLNDIHVPILFDVFSAGVGIVLIWLALAILVSRFAYSAFMSYQAENAGVRKQSPWLEVIVCVLAIYSFLGLASPFYTNPSIGLIFGTFAVTMIVAVALRFALVRRLNKLTDKHGLATYGIVAGIFLFGILFGWSGGFGYSSYQPNVSRISRIQISFHGAPELMPGDGDYRGNFMPILAFADSLPREDGGGDIILRNNSDLYFVTESDIQKVMQLHRSLIKAGRNNRPRVQQRPDPDKDWIRLEVRIRYHLESGRIVDRLYSEVPIRVAREMLSLHESDAVQNRMSETTSLIALHHERFPIYVTNNAFRDSVEIPVHDRLALLEALQDDIDNLTVDDIYFPRQPAHVIIHFPRLVESNGQVAQPSYSHFFADGAIALQSGLSGLIPFSGQRSTVSERCMHWKSFYITDAFANTLAFLAEFPDISTESALVPDKVVSMVVQRIMLFPTHNTTELYFRSGLETSAGRRLQNSMTVPQSMYGQILRSVRTNGFIGNGGYRVYVDFGGRRVIYFLPEQFAPDSIKQSLQLF